MEMPNECGDHRGLQHPIITNTYHIMIYDQGLQPEALHQAGLQPEALNLEVLNLDGVVGI